MTSEYYEQIGRDVERRKDISRRIQQGLDAKEEGYETHLDFAIGYDAWQAKKAELRKDGWEVRPYSEECSFFTSMYQGLFQRRRVAA